MTLLEWVKKARTCVHFLPDFLQSSFTFLSRITLPQLTRIRALRVSNQSQNGRYRRNLEGAVLLR